MRQFIVVAALLAAACGGSVVGPDGETERVEWTVDGQTYRASGNGFGALRSGAILNVTAADCGRGASINIQVQNAAGPGTYAVNGTPGANFGWTPDARTGASAGEAWYAPGIPRVVNNQVVSDGSGTVSITRLTGDWVSGVFSAEVIPNPQNRDSGRKRMEGRFELSFRERTIC